eukprot:SAG31_NODE_114_length_24318_cov_16.787481_15_plen_131_part_00
MKTEQPEAVKTFGVAALERLPDIIEAEVQARLAELDRLIADPGVVRDKVTTFVLANSDETDTNGEEIKRQHCEALAMFWKASTRGLLGDTLNTVCFPHVFSFDIAELKDSFSVVTDNSASPTATTNGSSR